jgi:hypothetical protein
MALFGLSKFIIAFLLSTIYIAKGGLIIAITNKFTFTQTLICVGAGGVFGSALFTFFFENLIKKINNYLANKKNKRKILKIKFTKFNRLLISTKRKFGIAGIAFLSPVILSIPLGTFLALKFFGGRIKVFFWFSFFSIFWTILIYLIFGYR